MRFLVVALALTLVASGSARAEVVMHRRVVLVDMPEVVFNATAAALGPWSIAVEATAGPPPADDLAAHGIARDHSADAVAWLDGEALVIYDDLRGRSERRAAPIPTDDVTAAAIALSIKTALRQPVEILRLPAVIEIPAPPPWPEVVVEPVVVPAPASRWEVHVAGHLGVGLPLTSPATPMVRADARLSIGWLAFAAGGAARSSLDGPALSGSYRELVVGAGVEVARPVRGWAVAPAALATLHVSHLDGTTGDDTPVARTMTTPGLEVSVAADRPAGPLRIGAIVTAEVLLRPTRYQVDGVDALVVPRFGLGFGLRVKF